MKKITIENAAYKWFDMKLSTYDKLEHNGSIYLYYDGDKYAEVRIDKNDKYIYFNRRVWLEFSEMFPMEYSEFKEVISKWVEDTFNSRGFTSAVVGLVNPFRVEDTFNLRGFTSEIVPLFQEFVLKIPLI